MEFIMRGKNSIFPVKTKGCKTSWKKTTPNPIVTKVTSKVFLIGLLVSQMATHTRGRTILSNFSLESISKGSKFTILMKTAVSKKIFFYSSSLRNTISNPIYGEIAFS